MRLPSGPAGPSPTWRRAAETRCRRPLSDTARAVRKAPDSGSPAGAALLGSTFTAARSGSPPSPATTAVPNRVAERFSISRRERGKDSTAALKSGESFMRTGFGIRVGGSNMSGPRLRPFCWHVVLDWRMEDLVDPRVGQILHVIERTGICLCPRMMPGCISALSSVRVPSWASAKRCTLPRRNPVSATTWEPSRSLICRTSAYRAHNSSASNRRISRYSGGTAVSRSRFNSSGISETIHAVSGSFSKRRCPPSLTFFIDPHSKLALRRRHIIIRA
jgi:hypothetical protein